MENHWQFLDQVINSTVVDAGLPPSICGGQFSQAFKGVDG